LTAVEIQANAPYPVPVFLRGRRRLLRALQVEVTSRCTRKCKLCPRSALSDRWLEGDLSREHWKRIEQDLTVAEHVHLQGWGEPLLHPDLPHLAQAAKQRGCSVGITTNGDLLSSATDWILAARVDLVTLSVAGDAQTHAMLRDGSRLDRVLGAAAELVKRARHSRSRMQVQLSYLLTRDNAGQLPDLMKHAADAGVPEVFVTHLDCTPAADLLAQAAFDALRVLPGITETVHKAQAVARRRKVRFRGPALQPEPLLTCLWRSSWPSIRSPRI
jgi:MoaA/NifB/PqqE/SkfB family radical SAM enzyme